MRDDHVCLTRPCVYCLVGEGKPLPPNVYVFPRPRKPAEPDDLMIPLDDDTVFQQFLRLAPRLKGIVARLIAHLSAKPCSRS